MSKVVFAPGIERELFAPLAPHAPLDIVDPPSLKAHLQETLLNKGLDRVSEGKPGFQSDLYKEAYAASRWDVLPHGAVHHVVRITRILKFQWECGHLLLIGRAGSRRSLQLKLAAHVLGMATQGLGYTKSKEQYTRKDLLRDLIHTLITKRKVCNPS
jgi:hypothetical protein